MVGGVKLNDASTSIFPKGIIPGSSIGLQSFGALVSADSGGAAGVFAKTYSAYPWQELMKYAFNGGVTTPLDWPQSDLGESTDVIAIPAGSGSVKWNDLFGQATPLTHSPIRGNNGGSVVASQNYIIHYESGDENPSILNTQIPQYTSANDTLIINQIDYNKYINYGLTPPTDLNTRIGGQQPGVYFAIIKDTTSNLKAAGSTVQAYLGMIPVVQS